MTPIRAIRGSALGTAKSLPKGGSPSGKARPTLLTLFA